MSIEAEDKVQKTMTPKELGTAPLSIDFNTSPEQFERERKAFRHAWFMIGRVDELKKPGDYFVEAVPTLKTSILTVRGRDGKIRSFHNMCKHRGNMLVYPDPQCVHGNVKGFSCGFHGWTYDTSGKLVIVPDEDQFYDLDKSENGLTEIPTEVWEGWVWISVEPKESLSDFLGDMGTHFNGAFTEGRYENMSLFTHSTAIVNANWKVILDAFSEAYHVPFIHGQTLPEAISGASNPLCHVQSIRLWDLHRSLSVPANPNYVPTPAEQAIGKFINVPVFPALSSDLAKLPDSINPEKNPYWGFDFHIFYPMSTFMVWANGMLLLYNYWPISVDQTRWMVKVYWNNPETPADKINHEITRAMVTAVVREDMSSLETTQETLLSGAADRINLSDQELAVRHSYAVIERMTRDI